MALKPKILSGKSSDIDDAEQVCFSRLDCSGDILRVVEQGSFRDRLGPSRIDYVNEAIEKIGHEIMIPIGQSQDSLLVVLAFVRGLGIGNDEWSAQAVRILGELVTVIPVCTRLIDLHLVSMFAIGIHDSWQAYGEIVCERLPYTNRALRSPNDTIHFCGTILIEAMKVQARRAIAQIILHIHNHAISHCGGDPWERPLTIDAHDRSRLQAIRVGSDPRHIEIVRDCGSMSEHTEG